MWSPLPVRRALQPEDSEDSAKELLKHVKISFILEIELILSMFWFAHWRLFFFHTVSSTAGHGDGWFDHCLGSGKAPCGEAETPETSFLNKTRHLFYVDKLVYMYKMYVMFFISLLSSFFRLRFCMCSKSSPLWIFAGSMFLDFPGLGFQPARHPSEDSCFLHVHFKGLLRSKPSDIFGQEHPKDDVPVTSPARRWRTMHHSLEKSLFCEV